VDFPTPPDAPTDEPLVKFGRPVPRPEYGTAGNRVAGRMRSMPPADFDFDRAPLRSVLRYLAMEAGIPYVGIPEHLPEAQRLVTFRMTNTTPFAALERVARQNNIQMTYDDGVWFMNLRGVERKRIENENELIGVIYHLKHDPLDVVTFDPSNQNNQNNQSGSLMSSGQQNGGFAASVPLQSSQMVFRVGMPVIVNQIRAMLGLSPIDSGGKGSQSGGGQVQSGGDDLPPSYLSATDPNSKGGVVLDGNQLLEQGDKAAGQSPNPQSVTVLGDNNNISGGGGDEQPQTLLPVYVPPQKPQVIYNSDTNILWVVATRKQHKWVAEYLQKVDKPQDLIAIEVKFFETNKNPQTDFGINWQGVLGGDGLQISGAGEVGTGAIDPETGRFVSGNNPVGTISGSNGAVTFNAPYSAVLTMQQATLAVQAFAQDREGSFVQYPRVLTINNREVAITSAEQTPISVGTAAVGGNATATQNVGGVQYLPTGTQINILPKSIGKDQIALTVAITISAIVGQKELNIGTGPNQYPVTTARVYNASLQVDSGYTLAVGGLEKTSDTRGTGGIPVLKDIPGVGYLFKNKGRNRDRSNLIIFITPY
ncbi:MAG: hypothetical protein KGQ89_10865, partial [Verrucomicrobia bacterium]|nr:hypothetical protein [Verrucomicrobiota bacterium]